MKDYERDKPAATPHKKLPAGPKQTDAAEAAAQRSVSAIKPDAAQGEAPAILKQEHLSQPANAGQLAGILSELQQSHGNAYVQQVVSGINEPKQGVEAPATSTGERLDEAVKNEMEAAFGESFGDVRVHTGGEARQMNEELEARAVTRGRDIYFAAGEYDPATREGKELLAHELAHTIQQKGGASSSARGSVGQAGDSFEREADRAASAVIRGERPTVSERGAAPAFQRQAPRRPAPQSPQRDAGTDAGADDYVHVVDLPEADVNARLGPRARFIYGHNPQGTNYTLHVLISPPLRFNSMRSTIDATFESMPHDGSESLTFQVTARRGAPIYLLLRFTHGRRNIDIRFNFPIRPAGAPRR